MSDILIRGMEMPKTCVQCDLKRYDQERIWTDNGTELLGAWVCKRTDEIIWNTQRGENCPLLPLPVGHGRLIDADALRQHILSEEEHYGYLDVHDLRNAPTIIEADLEWKMKNCCCFSNTDPGEGGTDNG